MFVCVVAGCGSAHSAAAPFPLPATTALPQTPLPAKTASPPTPLPSPTATIVPSGTATFHVIGIPAAVNSLTFNVLDPDGSPDAAFPVRTVQTHDGRACIIAAGSGGSTTCTFSITAPAGSDEFEITAYAATTASGTGLSFATVRTVVAPVSSAPVAVTFVGAVASIAFDQNRIVLPAGGATSVRTLHVIARDAAGAYLIPGVAFFAALTISISNDPNGAVSFTRSADPSAPVVRYDSAIPLTNAVFDAVTSSGLIAQSNIVAFRSTPSSIALIVGGPPATVSVSEAGSVGPFTATTSNAAIATVAGVASAAVPGASASFSVSAGSLAGSATLSLRDPSGVSATVKAVSSGSGTSIAIPAPPTITQFSNGITATGLGQIANGGDGNMWFGEGAAIAKVTPAGVVTEYRQDITGMVIAGVTAGPDGAIWFAENDAGLVGQIAADGTVSEDALSAGAAPSGITSGRDGSLWVTESGLDRIASVSPTGYRTVAEYPVATGAAPAAIAAGADGNLWFTEPGTNQIGRITTKGTLTEYGTGISGGAGLAGIAAGPDGNLWFAESSGNRIGRITTAGSVEEFHAGLSSAAAPQGITSGADGNLWFTESAGTRIGRITPSGVINEFSLAGATPAWIASADDGSLWFTQSTPVAVGRLRY